MAPSENLVVMKDVPNKLRIWECVLSTEQREGLAVTKVAIIMLSQKGCVLVMELISESYVVMKDVQVKLW